MSSVWKIEMPNQRLTARPPRPLDRHRAHSFRRPHSIVASREEQYRPGGPFNRDDGRINRRRMVETSIVDGQHAQATFTRRWSDAGGIGHEGNWFSGETPARLHRAARLAEVDAGPGDGAGCVRDDWSDEIRKGRGNKQGQFAALRGTNHGESVRRRRHLCVRVQPPESTLDALEWNFNERPLCIRRVEIRERQACEALGDEQPQKVVGDAAVGATEGQNSGERPFTVRAPERADEIALTNVCPNHGPGLTTRIGRPFGATILLP